MTEPVVGGLVDQATVAERVDAGDWGTEGDREWRQYVLSSDPAAAPEECPITVAREHPKSDRLAGVGDRHPGQVVR